MADVFSLVATLGLDSAGFLTGLATAGGVFSNFAGMVTGFVSDVMSTGMGFDQAMASVEAVLGRAEGTEENMTRLRAFALDQARESVFTAEQAAQAYYYMGMAGWKTEQMTAGLPAIMSLAAASGEDLGRVADIVTDSITAFGLSADDAQWYADVLAQAATNANTNVGLMGETFKYVAPIAGALGAGADDVAVSIGLMANAGIKGSMAGTALRQIFTRISTNAGETKDKLGALTIMQDKLGVTFRKSTGEMRDWNDIITDARAAWKGLDDETQIYYAKQIASERGMSGWLALMNATEDDVSKLTAAIGEASGAAESMANTRLDSLAGDVTKLNSAFDILKIAIYDDVKGPMREIAKWGTDAVNDITDAINEKGLTGGIEMLGQKIEEAADKFEPMLESIGRAASPVITSLLETSLPRLEETAIVLGRALGDGVFTGLAEKFGENSSAGQLFSLVGGFLKGRPGGVGSLTSGDLNPFRVSVEPEISNSAIDNIQAQLDAARERGDLTVLIDGMPSPVSVDYSAQEIYNAMTEAGLLASEQIGDALSAEIGSAGTPAASSFFSWFSSFINGEAPSLRDDLADTLGDAGSGAGASIVSDIRGALNRSSFTINVSANVGGIGAGVLGRIRRNASAMSAGRIFTSPTIFGHAEGAFQVAGDAGPEAVVGVNSLSGMIQSAVRGAMGGEVYTTSRAGTIPQSITVIMEMDGREFARATTPYIQQEQQRVGVKLVKGGAY